MGAGRHSSRWQRAAIAAALLLALLLSCSHVRADELEGFEDAGEQEKQQGTQNSASKESEVFVDQAAPGADPAASKPKAQPKRPKYSGPKVSRYTDRRTLSDWKFELGAAAFLFVYLFNMGLGLAKNHKLAEAWKRAYAEKDGIFDRNFAELGTGGPDLLQRDGSSVYKLYASGRRHCHGLLATLDFKPRQDALSPFINLFSPVEDTITLEVYMAEASMPPIVLAVATPKAGRALQREKVDIERLARKISVSTKEAPTWSNDKLWVLAEHSSIFYDLFGEAKVQTMFSHAANPAMKYFRSMHLTSENSDGSHRRLLRFVFALPSSPDRMEEVAKLMEMVPLFIDLVGSYRLSPELRKKAVEARQREEERTAQEEDKRKQRLEAIQRRKLEKMAEEKARVARMSPEARAKWEERQRQTAIKKQMKVKMVRM